MAVSSNTIQVAGPPTIAESALLLLQWMFSTTGILTDANIGSIIRTFGESIGAIDETEGIEAQAQAFQSLVFSAYNAYGITPYPAFQSFGVVTFTTGNGQVSPIPISIPAGCLLQTPGGIQFSTTATTIIPSGVASITNVNIQSLNTGSVTNVPAGSITQILTALDYPVAVTNPAPTTGGTIAETPSQTQARFLYLVDSTGLCTPIAVASAAMNTPPVGNEFVRYSSVYEGWITQIQNNETPNAGFVLLIDNGTGGATNALITSAYTWLSSGNNTGFRPSGVPFSIQSAQQLLVSVSVQATAINYSSSSSIQSLITNAISTYFASLGFGATAELSQLTVAIGNVTYGQISALTVVLENSKFDSIVSISADYDQRIIVVNTSVIVTSIAPVPQPNTAPQYYGFATGPPTGLYNPGNYNQGDWFTNSLPASGYPSGWVCVIGGSPDPCNLSATCGTWRTRGVIGDT